jgi:hypothetical protein
MKRDPPEIRVARLRLGECIQLRDTIACAVLCCAGTARIIRDGEPRDIYLRAGETFILGRYCGPALIVAQEGARNEWLDDLRFAVVALQKNTDHLWCLAPERGRTNESRSTSDRLT